MSLVEVLLPCRTLGPPSLISVCQTYQLFQSWLSRFRPATCSMVIITKTAIRNSYPVVNTETDINQAKSRLEFRLLQTLFLVAFSIVLVQHQHPAAHHQLLSKLQVDWRSAHRLLSTLLFLDISLPKAHKLYLKAERNICNSLRKK